MIGQWNDVRWLCYQCGRFIAASAIHEEDYLDNGAYYGVSTRTDYSCSRCGHLQGEPRLAVVAVREVEISSVVLGVKRYQEGHG